MHRLRVATGGAGSGGSGAVLLVLLLAGVVLLVVLAAAAAAADGALVLLLLVIQHARRNGQDRRAGVGRLNTAPMYIMVHHQPQLLDADYWCWQLAFETSS